MSRPSLDRWIRAWRSGGFDALAPPARQVTLRTPAEVLELAAASPATRCPTRCVTMPFPTGQKRRYVGVRRPMSDPITLVARAAAQRLEAEARPGLIAEVEAALAARETPVTPPPQYVDPVALASLIVGIASLAWTIYADLKKRTAARRLRS